MANKWKTALSWKSSNTPSVQCLSRYSNSVISFIWFLSSEYIARPWAVALAKSYPSRYQPRNFIWQLYGLFIFLGGIVRTTTSDASNTTEAEISCEKFLTKEVKCKRLQRSVLHILPKINPSISSKNQWYVKKFVLVTAWDIRKGEKLE